MFRIEVSISTPEQARIAAAVFKTMGQAWPQGGYSLATETDAPKAQDYAADMAKVSADVASLPEPEAETPAKRTRRTKAQMEADAAKADPAALYAVMTGAPVPETAPASLPAGSSAWVGTDPAVAEAAKVAEAEAEADFLADLQPAAAPKADTRTRDALLVEVRALAEEKGIIWMREVIEKAGGKKLSDLSDDVLRVLAPLA